MKTSKYSCGEIACIIFGVILALFIMLIVAVAIFFAVAPGRIFVFPIEQEIRDPPIEESLLRRVYPPAWSLNGDTIIFNYGTVRNVLLNHSHLQLDPAPGMSPDISPDGTRVASVTSRYGEHTYEIIASDLDGGNVKQVTDSKESSIWPKWSPDGSRIAFARGRDHQLGGNNRFHLYTMLKDGSDVQPLGHEAGAVSAPPVWSPDSSRLAFRNSGADALYVVNADGSGLRRIFDVPQPLENLLTYPAWSPDRNLIAFGIARGSNATVSDDTGIYVIDADGSNLRRILTFGNGIFPSKMSWSPDGSSILFIYNGGILVEDEEGGQRLTFVPADKSSEDALGGTSYQWGAIFTLSLKDSKLRVIEHLGPGEVAEVSWSPDGSSIAVIADSSPSNTYALLYITYVDETPARTLLMNDPDYGIKLAPEGWPPR